MATIDGVIRPGGPLEPCVLCTEPTDTRGFAPGLGSNVELPIHVGCAAWVVMAYRRRGHLTESQRAELAGYGARVQLAIASESTS